jgi:hypothetical protein
MTDTDPKAAQTALAALGLNPGASLLPLDGLVLTVVPREEGLSSKDIPVDALFHKLTMMRDKLRVLEQRVNAADGVALAERAALQAKITAVYAAMTGLAAFFSTESLPAAAPDDGGVVGR